jgi:phosphoribosylanthranilate isomerase
MRVRAKVCGITLPEWACAAAEAGADAIGLVFAESPRRVGLDEAAEIVAALPPWVAAVGVFVDASPEDIRETAAAARLTAVQLHGDRPPEILSELRGIKTVKAFRVGGPTDVEAAREWHEACATLGSRPDAYLVDARVEGGPAGGTGHKADWAAARELAEAGLRPLILAGGLGPENVAEAIRTVRPWGVDGSSRLESEPGMKDPSRIRAFLDAVRAVGD